MDKYTLRQYRYLVKEIEQLKADQQQLYDGRLGAVNVSDTPHGSEVGNPTLLCVEKLDRLQGIITSKLDKAIDLRIKIEDAIEGLVDTRDREIMRSYYIEGKTWERVAVDMNYSYMQITRIHGQALQKML